MDKPCNGRRLVRKAPAARLWLAAALLLLPSCGHPDRYILHQDEMRQQIRAALGPEEAAAVEIPFRIDDEIGRYTEKVVQYARGDGEKINLILDAMLSRISGGIEYEGLRTRNAVETFRSGTGNCLSFTNLFVGMSRHVGLPILFVAVDEVDDFEWSGDVLVHQKHMCAGIMDQGKLTIIDFVRGNAHYWRVRPIPDAEAVAFYYNNLGYAKFREGDLEGAVRDYRTATAVSPDFLPSLNNLGVALSRLGRLDEAAQVLRQALRIDDTDLSVLSNLAAVLIKKGDAPGARVFLARMEKVEASSPYALFVKGRLLRQRGEAEAALRLLRKASQKEPDNVALRLEMARAYRVSGKQDKSRDEFRKVLKLDPSNREALEAVHGASP